MSEELKPCPFCGTEDIDIDVAYYNPISLRAKPDEFRIGCNACGLEGYTSESKEEAIQAWNRRADDGEDD